MLSQEPKYVAIVVIAHNAERFINENLESIMNQTYPHFETFIINAGSTDITAKFLNVYANHDKRFHIFHTEHHETNKARNIALEEIEKSSISFEYIFFCEAEDILDKNLLHICINFLEKEASQCVIFSALHLKEDIKQPRQLNSMNEIVHQMIFRKNANENPMQITSSCTGLYNKFFTYDTVLGKRFLETVEVGFDQEFYFQVISNLKKVTLISDILYTRRHQDLINPENSYTYIEKIFANLIYANLNLDQTNRQILFNILVRDIQNAFQIAIKEKNEDSLDQINYLYVKVREIFHEIPMDLPSEKRFEGFLHYARDQEEKYRITLEKIKNKVSLGQKINVLLLSSENEKFGYESLYKVFESDEHFNVIVITFPHIENEASDASIQGEINFFKERNINATCSYQNKKYLDLKVFDPDIIFYQQPWNLPVHYLPESVSKYALTCYSSYSVSGDMINKSKYPYIAKFLQTLWKYFVVHPLVIDFLPSWAQKNSVAIGHPKLDAFSELDLDYESEKQYVIYAPHFSVGDSEVKYATFDWSGKFMLDFAKKHPDINWVFKPHPNLKRHFVDTKYMTASEVDSYFESWEKIGLVYTKGDYFDIFKESAAMISDCGSFRIEYFLTGKPFIYMISKNARTSNMFTRIVSENHYSVFNTESLEAYMKTIILEKNDFMKVARKKKIRELFHKKFNSAENIVSLIRKTIGIN